MPARLAVYVSDRRHCRHRPEDNFISDIKSDKREKEEEEIGYVQKKITELPWSELYARVQIDSPRDETRRKLLRRRTNSSSKYTFVERNPLIARLFLVIDCELHHLQVLDLHHLPGSVPDDV